MQPERRADAPASEFSVNDDELDPHELQLGQQQYDRARATVRAFLDGEHAHERIVLYPNEGVDGVWWTWWLDGYGATSYIHSNGLVESYGVGSPE